MRAMPSRRLHWVAAPSAGPSATVLDHFGPHHLVEWVIWILTLIIVVIVVIVVWRLINRGLPPD